MDDRGAIDDFQRFSDIVVGDQDADAATLEIVDDLADIGDGQGIDAGEGFIEQHEGRLAGQGAGDFDAAAFTTGQGGGRGMGGYG